MSVYDPSAEEIEYACKHYDGPMLKSADISLRYYTLSHYHFRVKWPGRGLFIDIRPIRTRFPIETAVRLALSFALYTIYVNTRGEGYQKT